MEQNTDSPAREALLSQMHSVTRSDHALLNRAIIARLPLCLPPHSASPYFYAAGMTVYGQIYYAIETIWEELEAQGSTINSRDRDLLLTLRTQYLSRTDRLQSDLQHLRRSLGAPAASHLDQLQAQTVPIRHEIEDALRAKPYLLLAYAWSMYLALFNGGRFIVNQLEAAGPTFWLTDENKTAQDCLSFWFFDESERDQHHGETVKIDLKYRLNAASELLQDTEKDEVISEAKRVFGICQELNAVLDQHAAYMQQVQTNSVRASNAGIFDWAATIIPGRSAWQTLRSVIGFTATPTVLRKEFEQHA